MAITSTIYADQAVNNDGEATVIPTSGVAPYSYVWSNSKTTQTIKGLSVGVYSVTITDANGDTGVNTVDVTQFIYNAHQAVSATAQCCIGKRGYKYLKNYIKGKDCDDEKLLLQFLVGAQGVIGGYVPNGTVIFDYTQTEIGIGAIHKTCIGNDDGLTYSGEIISSVDGTIATFAPTTIFNADNPFHVMLTSFVNQINHLTDISASFVGGTIIAISSSCKKYSGTDITINITISGWKNCEVSNLGGWTWFGGANPKYATYTDTEAFVDVSHTQTEALQCVPLSDIKSIEKILCCICEDCENLIKDAIEVL